MGRWTQSECNFFKAVPRHPAAVTDSQTRREGEPLASTEALMSHSARGLEIHDLPAATRAVAHAASCALLSTAPPAPRASPATRRRGEAVKA